MARKKGTAEEEVDPILFDDLDDSGPIQVELEEREPSAKPDDDQHLVAEDEGEELEIVHQIEEENKPAEEEPPEEETPADDPELFALDDDLRKVAETDRDLAFRLQDERAERADLLVERENSAKQLRQQQLGHVENRLKELPEEITRVKKAIVKAKEDGDTEAEMEAFDSFYKLRQEESLAQLARNQLANGMDEPAPQRPARQLSQAPQRSSPGNLQPRNQLATEFMRRNPWMGQARYTNQTQRLSQIDEAMAAEGLDPTKPDYYRELDRRLRVHFPDLPRTGAAARPSGNRSPVAPTPRGVVASRQDTSTRVTLTRDNIENMRRFNIDLKDKKAIARYAREKLSIARAEKARGK